MPTAPPSESPTNEKRSLSTFSSTRRARSPTSRSSTIGSPPWPGCSIRKTSKSRSASTCASHISLVAPSEPERTTVLSSTNPVKVECTVDQRVGRAEVVLGLARVGREALRLRQRLGAEVRTHALLVDLEAFERGAQRRRRAAGVGERIRERLPFRVPGAGRALVLVLEVEQDAGRSANVFRARAREHRPDRVPLVRHRRGLAVRRKRESRPTSVCASSARSSAIFAEKPAATASAAPSSASGSRRVCHGSTGSGRSRASAYACSTAIPSSPSAASVPAAPPSCAGRRGREARARVDDADEPARRLQSERRRHRLLQQRARRHHRCSVLLGEPRALARNAVELLDDSAVALRATSAAAVSRMSCDVAP